MPRLYRRVISFFINAYYWTLDSAYIAYWQLKGLISPGDPDHYLASTSSSASAVILLPGIYEKWHFMKPIAEILYKEGFQVHVIDELGYNRGTIKAMAAIVNNYASRAHLDDYTIVAHSKGGLIAKHLISQPATKVTRVVTINTPFSGSKLASLMPTNNIRIFKPTSQEISQLANSLTSNSQVVSIYGVFDPLIPGGSYLKGATNVQLPIRGHFRVVADHKVHKVILHALRSGNF